MRLIFFLFSAGSKHAKKHRFHIRSEDYQQLYARTITYILIECNTSAHVLLNLLNELKERDKRRGLLRILSQISC